MQAINFGTGFQSGFDTADNHFQQNRALDQRDDALAEASKRSDQQMAIQSEQLDLSRSNAEANQAYREQAAEATAAYRSQQAASTDAFRKAQLRVSGARASAAISRENREISKDKYALLRDRFKSEFNRFAATGEVDTEYERVARAAGFPQLTVGYHIADDNIRANLALRGPLSAAAKGDYGAMSSPEALGPLNVIYAPQVQQGVGEVSQSNGKKIVGKEISGFKLAPGNTTPDGDQGVVTMLKVSYEDGTSSEEPITLNRTSAKDDNVAISSVGTMIDDIQGRGRLAEIVSKPELQSNVAKARQYLFDDEAKVNAPSKIQEIDSLVANGMPKQEAIDTVYRNNVSDSPKIKEIQGYMQMGNMSFEEATRIANLSASNPSDKVIQLTTALMNNNGFGEDKLTLEQAREKATAAVQASLNTDFSVKGDAAPADSGKTPTPAEAAQPAGDPEIDKRLKIMRSNPKNEKYSDDQLRQAIQQKLGGKQ